jgi:hypothetical protein
MTSTTSTPLRLSHYKFWTPTFVVFLVRLPLEDWIYIYIFFKLRSPIVSRIFLSYITNPLSTHISDSIQALPIQGQPPEGRVSHPRHLQPRCKTHDNGTVTLCITNKFLSDKRCCLSHTIVPRSRTQTIPPLLMQSTELEIHIRTTLLQFL